MPLWLISILIGVAVGFLVAGILKAQLTSVRRQSNASSYVASGSLRLSVSTDQYLYENTTRVPRNKPNKK